LDIKHCVRCIALREDRLLPDKEHDGPTLPNGGQEFLGIEIQLFLRGCRRWYQYFSRNRELYSPKLSGKGCPKTVQFCSHLGLWPERLRAI
jgi:hypothetical protein